MRARKNKNHQALDFGLIGKVKIGMKHPQKGYPMSLDYFRFSPVQEQGNRTACEIAEQLYAHTKDKKRNALPICFSSDSADNLQNFFELRNEKGDIVAKHDGSVVAIRKTPEWVKWYETKGDFLTTPQTDRFFLLLGASDFGENSPLGEFSKFVDTLEARTKMKASKAGKSPRIVDQIKWSEVLVIRFVLINHPAIGRWEFRTKAEATTIGAILDAYDQVKAARDTIVGTHFILLVERIKTAAGKQFSMVKMVPVLNAREVNEGRALIDSVNFSTQGLQLKSGQEDPVEFNDGDPDYLNFDEV